MPQAKVRRTKSKWANKFTALTLRDEQLQTKKLQQKIETLLSGQFRTKPLTAAEQRLSNFVLQSSLLRKCNKEMQGKRVLSTSEHPQLSNDMYYVTELFEISKLPPGNLLKDWNAIQGRDLTPKKNSHRNDLKLQRIYAELEEYFKSLKLRGVLNDSVASNAKEVSEQEKEIDDRIIENVEKVQELANEFVGVSGSKMKTLKHHKTDNDKSPNQLETSDNKNAGNKNYFMPDNFNEDSIALTGNSVQSPLSSQIRELIPPTKDLDLMHVSGNTINAEGNEASTLLQAIAVDNLPQNNKVEISSNELPKTLLKTSLVAEDQIDSESETRVTNIMDISQYSLGIEINEPDNGNDTVTKTNFNSEQGLHTSTSLTLKDTNGSNIRTNVPDLKDISNYSLGCVEINAKQSDHNTVTKNVMSSLQEHSINKTPRKNDLTESMKVSSNSYNAQTPVNATQNNRSNSPDLFADSDVEMEDIDNVTKGLYMLLLFSNVKCKIVYSYAI